MKTLYTFLLLFIASQSYSQTYGTTIANTSNSLTVNYVTWWKITTGPSDSGVFTDVGFFDWPTGGAATLVRMALYDDDGTNPDVLLAETVNTVPINNTYNILPLTTTPTLLPNTTYWIAFKGNASHNTGEEMGSNTPIKYKSTTFNSPWPPTSSLSNLNAVSHTLYAIGNGQFVVPVEMLSFNGSVDQNQVNLNWETASETNNSGWEIQRSTNGHTWHQIGWVDGSNNTQSEKSYQYLDMNPTNGANFYRLKQMDHDGQYEFSDIIVFRVEDTAQRMYPNPVSDFLYHEGYDGSIYGLFDTNGKMVLEGEMENGKPIDMSHLPSGPYQLFYYSGIIQDQATIIKK